MARQVASGYLDHWVSVERFPPGADSSVPVNLHLPASPVGLDARGRGARPVLGRRPRRVESLPRESLVA